MVGVRRRSIFLAIPSSSAASRHRVVRTASGLRDAGQGGLVQRGVDAEAADVDGRARRGADADGLDVHPGRLGAVGGRLGRVALPRSSPSEISTIVAEPQ